MEGLSLPKHGRRGFMLASNGRTSLLQQNHDGPTPPKPAEGAHHAPTTLVRTSDFPWKSSARNAVLVHNKTFLPASPAATRLLPVTSYANAGGYRCISC